MDHRNTVCFVTVADKEDIVNESEVDVKSVRSSDTYDSSRIVFQHFLHNLVIDCDHGVKTDK